MIGLLHPPLGMVLFVLARVAKLSVERTTMAILPWLVPLFLALDRDHLHPGADALAADDHGSDPNDRHASLATLFGAEDLRMVERPLGPWRPAWSASGSAPAASAARTCTTSGTAGPATSSSPRRWCSATRSPARSSRSGSASPRLRSATGSPSTRRAGAATAPLPEGRPNLCENIYFMGSASKTPHMQGGFATFFDATPGAVRQGARHVTPLEAAALAEPLAVCWLGGGFYSGPGGAERPADRRGGRDGWRWPSVVIDGAGVPALLEEACRVASPAAGSASWLLPGPCNISQQEIVKEERCHGLKAQPAPPGVVPLRERP